ncbi:lysozyme inhibitor LprI family protein [Paraburkholderia sp. DHOC27]|uniref:lysozyme inhibitor LprI family protein n=1 Tax=Paraburkholderia sp. DHOC27 TaxID=2303330 RepID=UPI000E3C0C2A|nr:lysozyme inhibitor LprI family protein [Paraburkholderia sp. DHOC27]RFU48275.1 DUF1311 domain-containing protein [Paraburkholderia sp. DHOC27]
MKRSHYAAALLSVSFGLLSSAASAADCDHLTGGVGFASAQTSFDCAEKTRVANEQQLDDMVQKLLATLRDDNRRGIKPHTDFIAGQQAWVAYRNAECQFRNSLGSGAPQWAKVNTSQCLANMTAARVKNLQDYLLQSKSE